jgi:hypothetical protein
MCVCVFDLFSGRKRKRCVCAVAEKRNLHVPIRILCCTANRRNVEVALLYYVYLDSSGLGWCVEREK